MLATLALAVRAGFAQQPTPTPGERGDPYAPIGPPTQVQARYPVAQPTAATPQSQAPTATTTGPRYPVPQPAPAVAAPSVQAATATATAPATAATTTGELFEPTKIVAIVGNQYIFYGDVAPTVNQVFAPMAAKATNKYELAELEKARPMLTRQVLRQMVDTKLMYLDFRRQLETNAKDKLAEVEKDIGKRMRESFEKELITAREQVAAAKPSEIQEMMGRDPIMPRMAVLMRDNQAETLGELDTILRRYGSSLDKTIRYYGENRLGRSTVGKHVRMKPEVTHQEMLDYYAEHAADFALSAKCRFEILTIKFASFPSREQAYNTIAQLGNEIYFGAPFAAIARKHSQEPGAKNGGLYDWTNQGSLASDVIDRAIFTLEQGKLSQIIEDQTGYHIVRVLERKEAGQVDFVEAQPTIKKALETQKREDDYKKYVQRLKTGTQVWTIYDEEDAAALARQQAAGAARQR
jgi:parvulin-like peptidyl-prolyl isomerase